jgi:hypothetical protein
MSGGHHGGGVPFFHELEEMMNKVTGESGIRFEPWPLFILGLAVIFTGFVFMPQVAFLAVSMALFLAPVWLPYMLIGEAWSVFIIMRRSYFIAKQKFILLEIKAPRNLVKTPLAMEAFLSSIHLTGGESTWYDRFRGGMRPYFSLEIVSIEGRVHFYIWARESLRRIVESQMYAQYPGVQLTEVPDYTRTISADPHEWNVWGCDYKETADSPLPIKTYIEYGLDKVQKEPEQVDPIANIVEFMAAIGKGENIWLQFVIRAHKGERYGAGVMSHASTRLNKAGKPYTWKDAGKELIEKIRIETRGAYKDEEGNEKYAFPNPTKGESEKMAAIDRNISKLAFDVGIRGIYVARRDKVVPGTIGHLIALFKPFTTEGWNGLNSTKWMKTFDDYPWEFNSEKRKAHARHELVEAYRRRQFFYNPFYEYGLMGDKTPILSTEELATVFHIPSSSVETPGLERSTSAVAGAPANLPT